MLMTNNEHDCYLDIAVENGSVAGLVELHTLSSTTCMERLLSVPAVISLPSQTDTALSIAVLPHNQETWVCWFVN